jgi:hypothetical protein
MGHVIEPPDPNDHLYERIFSTNNTQLAWKRVKSNKGAAGIDKVSIEAFPGLVLKVISKYPPRSPPVVHDMIPGTWICHAKLSSHVYYSTTPLLLSNV